MSTSITLVPVSEPRIADSPITVTVLPLSTATVTSVVLYYRRQGDASWIPAAMVGPTGPGYFSAALPAAVAQEPGVEFYVRADSSDGSWVVTPWLAPAEWHSVEVIDSTTVRVEVGARGGCRVEVETDVWSQDAYRVVLRQLGETVACQGEPGQSPPAGDDCYARSGRWLRFYTPPLPYGLWRIEITPAAGGDTVYPGMLRVLPDDYPWHTYDLRRSAPETPYSAMGTRYASAERMEGGA